MLSRRVMLVFTTLAVLPLAIVAVFVALALRLDWLVLSPEGSLPLSVLAIGVTAGGLLAAAAFWWFLGRRLTAPLHALSEQADRLAAGDYAPALALELRGLDELTATADSLRRLATRMAEHEQRTEPVATDLQAQLAAQNRNLSQALGELRLLQQVNDAIVHNMPTGIGVLGRQGTLLYYNHSFEQCWRLPADAAGRDLRELGQGQAIGEIDWPAALEQLHAQGLPLRGVEVETGEWPTRRVLRYSLFLLDSLDPAALHVSAASPPDMSVHDLDQPFCLHTLAVRDCQRDGSDCADAGMTELGPDCHRCGAYSPAWTRHRQALLLLDDITDERGLEAQLIQSEKLAALGQLSAGIAHEMRNPLSAINNAAFYIGEVLSDEPPDLEELQDYIKLIQRNVDRAQRTVTNVLNFARPSGAEVQLADLAALAQETLAILDKAIVDAGCRQVTELSTTPVFCRPETVKQALLNLIVNALQAMPDGGTLTIGTERGADDEPHPRHRLVVHDTGVGIAPEHLPQVFNPFFTTKPVGQGTGLGLSIARRAIEADGGRLDVESVVGQGTTFRMALPAALEHAHEPGPNLNGLANGHGAAHSLEPTEPQVMAASSTSARPSASVEGGR